MTRTNTLSSFLLLLLLPLLCSFALSSAISPLTEDDMSSSDTIHSEEIVAPSLSQSPLLVNAPHFIPTASLFVPENTVTRDSVVDVLLADDMPLEEVMDSLSSRVAGVETSDTVRSPAMTPLPDDQPQNLESTSWNVLSELEEIDTESSPTITPEDVVQETQPIPIETYVAAAVDRKAKSEQLPSTRIQKESYLPDDPSLDVIVKNLTSDPEDLENALFNDTTGGGGSSSSLEEEKEEVQVDQSREASDESAVVTDRELSSKQTQTEVPTSIIITTTTTESPAVVVVQPQNHHPRKKQPKYIKKFRASASEVLRFFMEGSYLRSPLAVLVDTSEKTLQKTKILWNATLQQSTSNIDMVLMPFAHSGIYATYKFNNSRTLVAGLNSIPPSPNTDHHESSTTHTDNVFSTIIRASDHIPYDSAIFLFTNAEPLEDEVAQTAAIMLLKKRIRLYLFWFGGVDTDPESPVAVSSSSSSSATTTTNHRNQQQPRDVAGILGEVTLRTGGEIVYMSGEAIHANGDIGTVTLQLRNSFQGVQPFGIAVTDSETNSVNRSHESSEESKPSAPVASYSVGGGGGGEETSSRSNATVAVKDAEVIFSPDTISEVPLRRFENLRFPDSNQQTSVLENEEATSNDFDVVQFPDNDHHKETTVLESEEATSNALDIDHNENRKDVEIVSSSIEPRQSAQAIESNTQVQISPQSKLSALPGSQAQLYFEVTNLRAQPAYYYFHVIDEKQFVRQTQYPTPVLVGPGRTVTVTVNLIVPNTAVSGQRNKVTFTARGVTDVQQAVYFTVAGQNPIQDSWAPNLYWTYGSRCEWKTNAGVCSQHVWSVEITAQDWDTGILRLQSSPKGLLLRTPFTAGTREPVLATYSASCCQPKVTITAYDAANNLKTITLDVTDIWLSDAAIAAVVVGCILLIVLIVLLVILCRWCIRRRKATAELPVYRSTRSRSRQERAD